MTHEMSPQIDVPDDSLVATDTFSLHVGMPVGVRWCYLQGGMVCDWGLVSMLNGQRAQSKFAKEILLLVSLL